MSFRQVSLGAGLIAVLTTPVLTQNLAADLQRAKQREITTGDCKTVLADYLRIADQGVKSDRTSAGDALLRAGICHESLEDGLAPATYARVVAEFKDLRTLANDAAGRLARLAKAPKPNSTEGIRAMPIDDRRAALDFRAALSPDWRFAAIPNAQAGGLVLSEAGIGKGKLLVKNDVPSREVSAPNYNRVNADVVWSPDGREIAFTWGMHPTSPDLVIRRVNVQAGTTELVTSRAALPRSDQAGNNFLRVRAWVASQELVVTVESLDVFFVPIHGASPTRITLKEGQRYGDVMPDGSALVLVEQERLVLLDRATRTERVLARGFEARSPSVSIDGRLIAYLSNESGDWALRVAAVTEAETMRSISLAQAVGDNLVTRWAADGRLTSGGTAYRRNIYSLRLDLGESVGDRRLQRLVQSSSNANLSLLSPDDRRVVFSTEHGLSVMDADGSRERALGVANPAIPLSWFSRDEVVFATDEKGPLSAVNVSTGAVRHIGLDLPVDARSARVTGRDSWQYLGATNELVIMRVAGDRAVFTTRRPGGAEQPLVEVTVGVGSNALAYWELSPRRDWLAYSLREPSKPVTLYLCHVTSGETRDVGSTGMALWTSDGRRLVYRASKPRGFEVRSFDVETGQSRMLFDHRAVEGVIAPESSSILTNWMLSANQEFVISDWMGSVDQRLAWAGVTYDAVVKKLTGK